MCIDYPHVCRSSIFQLSCLIWSETYIFSPLDALIDELGGVNAVAEMTGRRGRMVRQRKGKTNSVKYELRDTGGNSLESLNNTEVR